MKKQYTKKQIQEAIAYWKKQLSEAYISERGKQYDPYVNGFNLTNVQDLADECRHFSEMGFGKTRLYINVNGRDIKLNNFGISIENGANGNKAVLYFNRKLDEGSYRRADESLDYEDVMYSLDYHRRKGNSIEFFIDDRAQRVDSVEKDGSTLVLNAEGPGSSGISVRTFVAMIQKAGFESPDDIQKAVLRFPQGTEYILDQTFNNAITSKVYGLQSEKLEWYFRKPRGW